EIAREVYSIEVIESLSSNATRTLRDLGYENVHLRVGDGRKGWPEAAPFDAIIVAAAAESVPPSLLSQLKVGGRLVIPVESRELGKGGQPGGGQVLKVLEAEEGGSYKVADLGGVTFVP